MKHWTVAAVAGLGLVMAGCGGPFGPCYAELVEARWSGTVDGSGATGTGQVAPGNIARFPELKGFLIDGNPVPGQAIAWTIEGVGPLGFLAVQLPATAQAGQVIAVAGAIQGGGWGFLGSGAGGAVIAATFGGAYATAASGTLTVVATEPLRLRADLTLRDPAGADRRLVGEITFRYQRDRTVCT